MIFIVCLTITAAGFLLSFVRSSTRFSLSLLTAVTLLNLVTLGWGLLAWDESQVLYFASNYFVSDATSRLFLVLINAVMIGLTPYVLNRVLTNQLTAKKINDFVRFVLLFILLSIVVVFSNHLIVTWMALEGTALAAVPLIFHQRGSASFRTAWKYLVFSSVGLGLTFLGLVLLTQSPAATSVSLFLPELGTCHVGRTVWSDLSILFCVLGLATKLGLAPMYAWLPETYDNAPPSVTGLLAAIQFNCAIFMLFRLLPVFRSIDPALLNAILIGIGLISLGVSAMSIVATKNYKRLIAYAAINHAGMIALGLGIGKSADYGVILYVLSNALVKAILFFTAGNIKARFATKNMTDLHGLIKDMPYSGAFFMIGIFALLGFAPFGSFIGEVMIMSGIVETGHWLVFALLCLLIAITFIATGRSVFPMIWGEPKLEVHKRPESIFTLLPNLFYLAMLLSLGIYIPTAGNDVLIRVAQKLGGQ